TPTQAGHVYQYKHLRDAGGSCGPDAVMTGDYLQTPLGLGAERKALKSLVARNGLRQALEHSLGHRAGVDILLAQGRGVNLPEFQAVAEFQNSLRLDYGGLGRQTLG